MCNGASDSSDLNGNVVAVVVLVISALILCCVAGITWMFEWAVYKKLGCLKLEPLELARA